MSKVKIGLKGCEQYVELDAGQLILMKRARPDAAPVLEVIEEIREDEVYRCHIIYPMSPCYRLVGAIEINGKKYPSVLPGDQQFTRSNGIKDVIVGKDEIMGSLEHDRNLSIHLDWIRKLEKPYCLPKSKTLRYLASD